MLVFYRDFGQWIGEKEGLSKKTFQEEKGIFVLDNDADQRELRYKGEAKVSILKSCYTHPDALTLDGFDAMIKM